MPIRCGTINILIKAFIKPWMLLPEDINMTKNKSRNFKKKGAKKTIRAVIPFAALGKVKSFFFLFRFSFTLPKGITPDM